MASSYSLKELYKDANRNRKHTCPNCNGDGMVEVYAYEKEKPWLRKPPSDVDLCTLCMGSGFVDHKLYIAYMRRI